MVVHDPAVASIKRLIAPLLVGIPVLLLVVASLGGLSESNIPGLPVVPFATLISLPVDIWIRDIAMAVTVGGAIVGGGRSMLSRIPCDHATSHRALGMETEPEAPRAFPFASWEVHDRYRDSSGCRYRSGFLH